MKRLDFGETFGRHSSVDENKDVVYVTFTDWTTRQGGSVDRIALDLAVALAKVFVSGRGYTFEPSVGIVLDNIKYGTHPS